ncbi:BCCT family transporter [Microbulbifer sp. SH-1]|uniref:BCCT family transporter n=1 Tax=Microbulbifer sp. SH-1 TaxID=2681547 RepID=UPI00140E01C0|nr:BCCT family transporter [Microbulbifer sp. SH-1]QIL88550.1 BCCT family transporter [Microbulbifer sp. SH-1]
MLSPAATRDGPASPLRELKPIAFWPTLAAMLLALVTIAVDPAQFVRVAGALNAAIVDRLSPLYLYSALALLLLCIAVFVSPLGRVRIGGDDAKPIYSPFRWFSVSLTTVIAMGILFWAVAEPVLHFREPPPFAGVQAGSDGALRFAMSTVFVHWTLVPYAIYTVAGLTFALGFYNRGYGFSVDALLHPLLGTHLRGPVAQLVDGMVLFSAVVGMSAVLSGGLLLIGDGLQMLFGIKKSPLVYAVTSAFIIAVALLSAASGLRQGIQLLARVNTVLFLMLMLYVLALGPSAFIARAGGESLLTYLSEFIPRHLMLDEPPGSRWSGWWTTAFFASWFAWAPLSCLFLGKIARGYTVRQFILVNLLLPSAFGALWFSVFGLSALYFDIHNEGAMYGAYQREGLAIMAYQLFGYLPGGFALSLFFIFACLISFITATDSNTDAIGGLCKRVVTAREMNSPFGIKLLWAGVIGAVGWCSVTFLGVDGIKMLANLAGLPGLLIVLGSAGSLIVLLAQQRL